MKKNIYYATVSEAINGLIANGYTTDFNIHTEDDCLVCQESMAQLSPEEFEIDETFRFEGQTDPGDEMIVYAISSIKNNMKGIVVNAYGMYADDATSKIIERLHKHVEEKSPIKRNESLQPISREHHHGLLLCWKIRTGLKKGIAENRILDYANWFYKSHLIPHFEIEEKYIYPILGHENEWIKKALAEHQDLKRLFESTKDIKNNLEQIDTILNSHIRFEERILFNKIQEIATDEQLEQVNLHHKEEKFEDNLSDPFLEN